MAKVTLPLRFDQAIRRQNVKDAVACAREFRYLPLYRALELTILFGRTDDPRYEAAARRFLARFIVEIDPRLKQIMKVTDGLDNLRLTSNLPALREGADTALEDLARQLRER